MVHRLLLAGCALALSACTTGGDADGAVAVGMPIAEARRHLALAGASGTELAAVASPGTVLESYELSDRRLAMIVWDPAHGGRIVGISICANAHLVAGKAGRVWQEVERVDP